MEKVLIDPALLAIEVERHLEAMYLSKAEGATSAGVSLRYFIDALQKRRLPPMVLVRICKWMGKSWEDFVKK